MEINFGAEEALRAAVGYDTIPYWSIKTFVAWLIGIMLIFLIPEKYIKAVMSKKVAYIYMTFLAIFVLILSVTHTDPLEFFITFFGAFTKHLEAGCRNSGTGGFSIEFMWWMIIWLVVITITDAVVKRVHFKSGMLTWVLGKGPALVLLIGCFCIWNDVGVITLVTSFVTAFVTGLNF